MSPLTGKVNRPQSEKVLALCICFLRFELGDSKFVKNTPTVVWTHFHDKGLQSERIFLLSLFHPNGCLAHINLSQSGPKSSGEAKGALSHPGLLKLMLLKPKMHILFKDKHFAVCFWRSEPRAAGSCFGKMARRKISHSRISLPILAHSLPILDQSIHLSNFYSSPSQQSLQIRAVSTTVSKVCPSRRSLPSKTSSHAISAVPTHISKIYRPCQSLLISPPLLSLVDVSVRNACSIQKYFHQPLA